MFHNPRSRMRKKLTLDPVSRDPTSCMSGDQMLGYGFHRPNSRMGRKLTLDPLSGDFTIVVDGTEFKCQREVLSSVSNYFDALFRSNMKETLEGWVELTNMSSQTFATVLNFIHERVPGLTDDNIDDVWEAANRLDIGVYLKECEQYVVDHLSLENLAHFNQVAVDLNSQNVKDGLVNFMKRNFENVLETVEFLSFSFPFVLSLVEDEQLNVEKEDIVLEGILSWVSRGRIRPGTIMSPDENQQGTEDKWVVVEVQDRGGQSCDVTSDCQSAGSSADVQDGEAITNTPGDVIMNTSGDVITNTSGDVISTNSGDVITTKSGGAGNNDGTDDRRKYLAILLSSAKLVLASRSYLQSLLAHPYISTCPSAYDVVHEALKFKVGAYPFESTLMTPYRNCSGKRNVMAFIEKSCLRLYDLESRTFSRVQLDNIHARIKSNVSIVSLGSKLAFVAVKYQGNCTYARHKCRPKAVLTLDENKKLNTLYEVCGKQNMPMRLVNVNGKIFNVCHAATRSCVLDQDSFGVVKFEQTVKFQYVYVFENDILLFYNSDYINYSMQLDTVIVHVFNLETKSLTTSKIPVVFNGIVTVIHKEKDMFLLLSSGILLAVKRGADNTVQFTHVTNLWSNFDWMLRGAAYYKGELFLFYVDDGTVFVPVLASAPGLFEKISVVELEGDLEFEGSNIVPMVVPASWVDS